MTDLVSPLRARLQQTFNGQATGTPQWMIDLEKGDDEGFFEPGSAVWAVHGAKATIAAGVRALLVQALHPGALAGVHDHSRFKEDPLGRLAGTIRWIYTVTYGSRDAATQASNWVSRLHTKVVGQYDDRHGVSHGYAANDPELLSWVHMAFADSFLAAFHRWGGREVPGGPDAYVREWAVAGELMGVPNPPLTVAEMQHQLMDFDRRGVLERTSRTDDVVRFIRRPPLFPVLRAGYPLLFNGAVATLQPRFQELLDLRPPHVGPVELPTAGPAAAVLRGVGAVMGPRPPAEKHALTRLERLGWASV
ncbi:oxygenase MpaB family protein [Frigoribacterium sp. CFBP9030]|uniref:oxygenase MpaB family protein n=1 Tax=Frigoribacterium sp. CFBP9030 TaxID=3096537 RepID=UPI002A6B5F63|nr:oxygenase MpaB family protein [Frigoribacterium sp. CFBP9030]MDY0890570.1 oxygenase MpaB family protein [Frigoribacterium sp. CFBP9030]